MRPTRFLPAAIIALLLAVCPAAFTPVHAAQQPAAPAPAVVSKAPAVVFILRHAEKPEDDKDANLAPAGFKRAQALPSLFLPTAGSKTLPRLPRPNVIFATDASKHSNRPVETIAPLAAALKLPIHHDFADRETQPLAAAILGGKYAGQVVLVCWHHGEIPHLAQALGVTDAPKKWDDTVFDQIWMIEYIDGQPHFSTLPQHLMPGDSTH